MGWVDEQWRWYTTKNEKKKNNLISGAKKKRNMIGDPECVPSVSWLFWLLMTMQC